jgi:hypothetical protein
MDDDGLIFQRTRQLRELRAAVRDAITAWYHCPHQLETAMEVLESVLDGNTPGAPTAPKIHTWPSEETLAKWEREADQKFM